MFGRNSLLLLKMHKYLHLGILPCWPDWPQNLGLKRCFASSAQAAAGTDTLYPASEFLFLALAENQLDKYSLFLHGYFDSWQGNEVAIYSEHCLINNRNSTVYQVHCSFAHRKISQNSKYEQLIFNINVIINII